MVEVALTFDDEPPPGAQGHTACLRGAVGRMRPHEPLFHQHDEHGKPLYRYPLVHYRWHKGPAVVAGFAHAADVVRNVNWLNLQIDMDGTLLRVIEATIRDRSASYGIADRLLRYSFASPVLLFSQRNYGRYKELDKRARASEADRLLVAQTLTALRGLGVEFTDRLYAALVSVREVPCVFKGQTLLGLYGELLTNALVPDGFALGHAVSHGFGCLVSSSSGQSAG
jgi:hypothetical protein